MRIAEGDWKRKLPKTPWTREQEEQKKEATTTSPRTSRRTSAREIRGERQPNVRVGDEKTSPVLTHQPLAAEEGMEVEEVQMSEANDDDAFADKANPKTESRVKTPERRPPV